MSLPAPARDLLSRLMNTFQYPNIDYFINTPTDALRQLSHSLSVTEVSQLCGMSDKLAEICTDEYWRSRVPSEYQTTNALVSAHDLALYLEYFSRVRDRLRVRNFDPQMLAKEIIAHPYQEYYLMYPLVSIDPSSTPGCAPDVTLSYFPGKEVVIVGMVTRTTFVGSLPALKQGKAFAPSLIESTEVSSLKQDPRLVYRAISAHILYQLLGDARAKGYVWVGQWDNESCVAYQSLVNKALTIRDLDE